MVDSSASYAEDGTLRSGCAPWATTTPATNVASGERRRDYLRRVRRQGTFVDTIPKYDSVRYRRDGSPVYYNKPSSSSNRRLVERRRRWYELVGMLPRTLS